ncbi:hypothetical protein D3C71_1915490 [compost metagenome]
MVMQGRALQHQRRDRRNFGGLELGGKRMLFIELRAAPAARAVELGDHAFAVFEKHLVDPVLVRAQRGQPAIPVQTDRGQCVQHHIGRELFIGVGAWRASAGGHGHRPLLSS